MVREGLTLLSQYKFKFPSSLFGEVFSWWYSQGCGISCCVLVSLARASFLTSSLACDPGPLGRGAPGAPHTPHAKACGLFLLQGGPFPPDPPATTAFGWYRGPQAPRGRRAWGPINRSVSYRELAFHAYSLLLTGSGAEPQGLAANNHQYFEPGAQILDGVRFMKS